MFDKSILQSRNKGFYQSLQQRQSRHIDFERTVDINSFPIDELLNCLDPNYSYDFWLDVGHSLHASGFPLSVWEKWSELGERYRCEPERCEDEWDHFIFDSFKSLGWLVSEAIENSYKLPAEYEDAWIAHQYQITVKDNLAALHWSELSVLPKRKYLIKGLLEQGGMSVVFGPSNSGKTFLALDMACHIAYGWPWHESKVRKGAVVYVAGEGGLGISERLIAFKKHHSLDDFADVYVIPSNILLCKDESAHDLLLKILLEIPDVKLLIVDTLARAMGGGDENNSSDMGSLIKNCDIIRSTTGVHVMLIHHTGKEESRGARGHSSLKAAVDTEVQVLQRGKAIQATVLKQREGRTGHHFCFNFVEYKIGHDEDGDPIYSCALDVIEFEHERPRLKGQAQQAYQVLLNLMIAEGFDHRPKAEMPIQKVVRLDAFKDHFKKAGIANSDKADSVDKAFNRSKNKLKDLGYIAEWDNHIWLLDKEDNAGQT